MLEWRGEKGKGGEGGNRSMRVRLMAREEKREKGEERRGGGKAHIRGSSLT